MQSSHTFAGYLLQTHWSTTWYSYRTAFDCSGKFRWRRLDWRIEYLAVRLAHGCNIFQSIIIIGSSRRVALPVVPVILNIVIINAVCHRFNIAQSISLEWSEIRCGHYWNLNRTSIVKFVRSNSVCTQTRRKLKPSDISAKCQKHLQSNGLDCVRAPAVRSFHELDALVRAVVTLIRIPPRSFPAAAVVVRSIMHASAALNRTKGWLTRVFVRWCAQSLFPKRSQRSTFHHVQANMRPYRIQFTRNFFLSSIWDRFCVVVFFWFRTFVPLQPIVARVNNYTQPKQHNTEHWTHTHTHALLRCRFWSVLHSFVSLFIFNYVCRKRNQFDARHRLRRRV